MKQRTLTGMLVALLALLLVTACNPSEPNPEPEYGPRDDFTAVWTLEQAIGIERTETNTMEPFDLSRLPRGDNKIFPDHYLWDSWPVRNRDSTTAKIGEYVVFMGLTAPDFENTSDPNGGLPPGSRHGIAEIRYYYTDNGEVWTPGGPIFPEGTAFGTAQWASSALVEDDGSLFVFYTATGGEEGSSPVLNPNSADGLTPTATEDFDGTALQRLALAWGPKLVATENGIEIQGEWNHKIILEADGELYQTLEQSLDQGIIYAFRDPWFWQDPEDGNVYLLFEGNTPNTQAPCEEKYLGNLPEGYTFDQEVASDYNGNVGIAIATNPNDLVNTDWELLPPLIEAVCVNQQLERPHFVYQDGLYYLFVDSHEFTFPPIQEPDGEPLYGPDALYGFVNETLRGTYEPLNGHGLVIANPEEERFQAYSWLVTADRQAISFAQYFNLDNLACDGQIIERPGNIAVCPDEVEAQSFGGTLAPTTILELNGNTTRLIETLAYGQILMPGTP